MYVQRNNGVITAISSNSQPGFEEFVSSTDPELQAFMASASDNDSTQNQTLRKSDIELARVLEDLIDLLSQKGLIQFTDLPDAAQQKLLARKEMRSQVQKLDIVDTSDSDDFMP